MLRPVAEMLLKLNCPLLVLDAPVKSLLLYPLVLPAVFEVDMLCCLVRQSSRAIYDASKMLIVPTKRLYTV